MVAPQSISLPNYSQKLNPDGSELMLISDLANGNATRNMPTNVISQVYGVHFVEAYGAKGDGLTDDSAAFQAALDAAKASGTGGCVAFGAKTYVLDKITVGHRTTLMGLGSGSVLKQKASSLQNTMINLDPHGLFIRLKHFRLDGNYANQTQAIGTGPHGIYGDYTAAYNPALDEESDPYPKIEDVEIYNTNGDGVHLAGRGEIQMYGCMLRNIGGNGVVCYYDTLLDTISVGVVKGAGFLLGGLSGGGKIHGTNLSAFHCGNPQLGADASVFSTATNSGTGFNIFNCEDVVLTNCVAQDCAGPGFNLDTVIDSQLIGCTADSISQALNGDPGFNLANCQRNKIRGHVRDRKPYSYATVRHAVRTWSFAATPCSDNDIELTYDLDTSLASHYPVYPPSMNANADGGKGERIVIGTQLGNQFLAYAASITPNPYKGGMHVIDTLTGNITIANTAAYNKHYGVEMSFMFTQDGTGGKTVSFGTDYQYSWSPNTGAGKVNTIKFFWNGTKWIQIASQVGV